jgi:MraZ protein
MIEMYRGATLLNLDGKSRLAIPTKYREVLILESSRSIVLTAHPHGCLLLYPKSEWEPIQEKVMKFSSFDKKSSGLQRLLVGYAEDVNVDASGRILLSAELRTYANIDKSLMLVGQGTHFELWSKDSWEEEIKQIDINQENELSEELGGFSL